MRFRWPPAQDQPAWVATGARNVTRRSRDCDRGALIAPAAQASVGGGVSSDARRFARIFLPPLLLILAGVIVLGLVDQLTVAAAVGWTLTGLGAIWAVSAAFYEVGRSEDRARERHPRG